jgi:hypothetical protein
MVSFQLHAPAELSLAKEPRYPFDRRLDVPQSRSWRCDPFQESNPGRPAWLSYRQQIVMVFFLNIL